MGRVLRRVWWAHPWMSLAPLLIVLVTVQAAVDVSDDFAAGLFRVFLVGVAGGLGMSVACAVRAPLLLAGWAGRIHQPVFWSLTVTERLEVADSMRAGRSPDDKRLAAAVVEVAESSQAADDLWSRKPVSQAVFILVGAIGGMVLVRRGDGGLGAAVLLIALLDVVAFGRRSRQEKLMREKRDEALRSALPHLNRREQ